MRHPSDSTFAASRLLLATLGAAAVLVLFALVGPLRRGVSASEELPPGVEQIIPRGAIAAILDPEFVPAQEAEITEDAWVLGVAMNGEARAYSLNLLNRHEVVNDRIAGRPVAAVW
jgi:hypothetical protein